MSHERLIKEREAQGVGEEILNLVKVWSVDGVMSALDSVSSGVPQGFLLGPPPLIIFINDTDSEISSYISKSADDAKIGLFINLEGVFDRSAR